MALSKYHLPDFKFLFSMAVGYGVVSMMTYFVMHMEFIGPLPIEAPLNRCLFHEDYLSWFMVCTETFYAKRVAQILHTIPILLFFVMAFAFGWSHSWVVTLCELMKGFMFHAVGVILAIIVPVVFPCLAFDVYFVIEKMSMMCSLPLPHGHYVPDMIVAAVIGAVTAWSVSPLMPICGDWLARPFTMHFLLHLTVLGLAISPYFSPYSTSAPKII